MDVSSINGAHSGIGALWQKGNFCFWVKTKNLGCDIQIQSPTADLKSNLVSSLTIYHFHLCHKHFKIMSNSTMRFEYETCGDLFCKENTLRCFTDVRKVITPAVIYSRVDFHWDYFMYQLLPFKIWCCIPCDNALIIHYSLGVKTTGETSAGSGFHICGSLIENCSWIKCLDQSLLSLTYCGIHKWHVHLPSCEISVSNKPASSDPIFSSRGGIIAMFHNIKCLASNKWTIYKGKIEFSAS